MAIDTATKRRSLSGILTGIMVVGVTMDATKAIGWRQNAGWGYSGIEAETVQSAPYEAFRWRGQSESTVAWTGQSNPTLLWRGEQDSTESLTGEL